jgi:hypothetical protein
MWCGPIQVDIAATPPLTWITGGGALAPPAQTLLRQNEPGTLEDFYWEATVPCVATSSTSIGATCALQTTVDTLLPGTIKEGRRTVWEQHDHIHVFDGGEDRLAATEDDNLLFMVQSCYVP